MFHYNMLFCRAVRLWVTLRRSSGKGRRFRSVLRSAQRELLETEHRGELSKRVLISRPNTDTEPDLAIMTVRSHAFLRQEIRAAMYLDPARLRVVSSKESPSTDSTGRT